MEISDVIKELREINEPVPKPFKLPTEQEVQAAEKTLGVKFCEDYRRFLLEASDVTYGNLEPAVVVSDAGYLHLIEVANSAWDDVQVPLDLLPICEDNGDYYCLNKQNEVVFWSGDAVADEKWNCLADWIKTVWIEGN